MIGQSDIETYRQLSKPFDSNEAADKVIRDFYAAVANARKEFGLPNVHILVGVYIKDADGREAEAISSAHFGDSGKGLEMCAWGYGKERAEMEERIGDLVDGRGSREVGK